MFYDVFNIKYEFCVKLCCLRLERTLYISSAVIAFDTSLQVFCLKGPERRTGKSGVG